MQSEYTPERFASELADDFVRALPIAGASVDDLIEHARSRGYLVIGLPGVGTFVLSPDDRDDDPMCVEIKRRTLEVEDAAARAMPTDEEARAWTRMKRTRRARNERHAV